MARVTRGIACRTWEACWVDEYMQYAYDRGVFEGAAILQGFIGMAEAIRAKADCGGHCFGCMFNAGDCENPLWVADDRSVDREKP